MLTPLLTTKFHRPDRRKGLVARPHLIARLDEGLRANHRLTLIISPAGYGKTTLASEWVSQQPEGGWTSAWLSLDDSDNDPMRFVEYLIAALRSLDPTLGQSVAGLVSLASPPPAEWILTPLINDLLTLQQRMMLVLDDYHAIQHPWIHTAVSFILQYQPANFHLVMVTREEPPLHVARLRVLRLVTDIGSADLRFSESETTALLNDQMRLGLSPDAIRALESRTEGWIAALQLAAVSLQQHRDSANLLAAPGVSQQQIFAYLADEVVNRQPPAVRAFLVETSILDRLCAPLCDAITGRTDSRKIIASLYSANLFLMPLDETQQWYRYHPLFAEYLRAELDEEQRIVLNRRAAEWYQANGSPERAVTYALATHNPVFGAQAVAQAADRALQRGELTVLLDWLRQLPDSVVRASGELAEAKGWGLLWAGRLADAAVYAQAAKTALAEKAVTHGRLICLQAFLSFANGDYCASIDLAHDALRHLAEDDLLFRGFALLTCGYVQRRTGDEIGAIRALLKALQFAELQSSPLTAVAALIEIVEDLDSRGRRQEAVALCKRAIDKYVDARGEPLVLAGSIYVALGILEYEANDLPQAYAHVQRGLELCAPIMLGPELCYPLAVKGYMQFGVGMLARIQYSMGQAAAAAQTIQAALIEHPDGSPLDWYSAIEADLAIRQGNYAVTERWLHQANLPTAAPLDVSREREYYIYVHYLLAQQQFENALRVLEALEHTATHNERNGSLIRIYIFQALALNGLGHPEQAVESLARAIRLAEPQGYRRPFLDEGAALLALLRRSRHISPGFVDDLLAMADPQAQPPRPPLIELLNPREREVLRLLASGAQYKEIAERLNISLNTVRFHVKHIYGKLDAHNLAQALSQAEKYHLI